ncbi:uncharacterized protein PHACADRAFT_31538 [Phanerochaete carnosa HHB-10118-sp]|uniref:Uncharacterized protein n=1 Tax=Phanerochaete carnosa (strain HHB-10118-sp) TaxID=650164 RepID=K5VYN0_PHACS|nr:uncharacterized protein PHACADRAFT_31538 [Phanerochaete carnosa HHB-10118-sp]EKM51719.1 hypothetical protein PHACADRAFT_31538 [Phanerochaete carnosa HHB-10118-sp]
MAVQLPLADPTPEEPSQPGQFSSQQPPRTQPTPPPSVTNAFVPVPSISNTAQSHAAPPSGFAHSFPVQNLTSMQPTQNPPPPPPPTQQQPSPQNPNPEAEVAKIWGVLNELLEQLSANRQASIQLHSLAAGVKSQAIHSQTGYVLRRLTQVLEFRYNLDRTQDEYNAALEKMNAQMTAENTVLVNENKQMGTLIKEYEQTLENVMAGFRVRANEVQQRELSIMREYERKLLTIETAQLQASLAQQTTVSTSLGRVGELLRVLMRVLGGEDPSSVPTSVLANMVEAETGTSSTGTGLGKEGEIDITGTAGHMTIGRQPQKKIINSWELEAPASPMPGTTALPPSPSDSSTTLASSSDSSDPPDQARYKADILTDKEAQLLAADWALERECELARLEQENAMLHQLVQEREKLSRVTATSDADVHITMGEHALRLELPKYTLPKRTFKGKLGGKDIGPYGMYKKFEE